MASTINAKNTSTGVVITPDASGQLELQTADTTRMTIDVNGNVGVGTSSPTSALHVYRNASGTLGAVRVESGPSAQFAPRLYLTDSRTGQSGRDWGITSGGNATGALCFDDNTAGLNRMVIDSSGNVGIGTSSPAAKLDVSGTGFQESRITSNTSGNARLGFNVSGSVYAYWEADRASGAMIYNNGTERMRIDSSGRVSMPFQVGFKVGRTSPAQTVANGGTLIFNTTASAGGFNTGNAYNTSSGNFTAPISGRYIFNATVIFEGVATATNFADIVLLVNGGAAAYGLRQTYVTNTTGSGGFFVDKLNVILNLVAGDVVAIVNLTGTSKTLHANPGFAIFDGYLLG